MKNQTKFLAILIITCLLTISITSLTYAADIPSSSDALGQQFGINTETPIDIKENITNTYLKGEWGKIIASKPIIGPIHNFFVNNPKVFQVLFNEPYEFSLHFLIVFIFWLLCISLTYDALRYTGLKQLSILAGFLVAIMIAHTKLLTILTTGLLAIISKQELWYIRLILWLIVFVFLIVSYQSGKILKTFMKKKAEEREKAEMKQEQKVNKKFIRGVREGAKFTVSEDNVG